MKVKCVINDLGCLADAAKHLGLDFVADQQKYKWYGRSVGDYPLPEGVSVSDLGKCDHAIRVPGNSTAYEIGVVKRKNGPGYDLLFDFWNRGYGMQDLAGDNANKLVQEYKVRVAMKDRIQQGYQVTRTQGKDGRVVLKAIQ